MASFFQYSHVVLLAVLLSVAGCVHAPSDPQNSAQTESNGNNNSSQPPIIDPAANSSANISTTADFRIIVGMVIAVNYEGQQNALLIRDSKGDEHVVYTESRTVFIPQRSPVEGDKVTVTCASESGFEAALSVSSQSLLHFLKHGSIASSFQPALSVKYQITEPSVPQQLPPPPKPVARKIPLPAAAPPAPSQAEAEAEAELPLFGPKSKISK
jgi:hypothetical protein